MKMLLTTHMAKLRVLAHLTQAELAEKIGKSRSLIMLIETHRFFPTKSGREAIAYVLNVNEDELFGGDMKRMR